MIAGVKSGHFLSQGDRIMNDQLWREVTVLQFRNFATVPRSNYNGRYYWPIR